MGDAGFIFCAAAVCAGAAACSLPHKSTYCANMGLVLAPHSDK